MLPFQQEATNHAIRERLAATDPSNAAWQRDVSASLIRVGDVLVAQRDRAGALTAFQQLA